MLLALRCGAIGLLALALARPSVASAALSSWLAAGLHRRWPRRRSLCWRWHAAVRQGSKLLVGGLSAAAGVLALLLIFAGVRALAGGTPVLGDQEAPVAAVIVIDTSPRMQYRHENETRLERPRRWPSG